MWVLIEIYLVFLYYRLLEAFSEMMALFKRFLLLHWIIILFFFDRLLYDDQIGWGASYRFRYLLWLLILS